jgi:hypothetical protein
MAAAEVATALQASSFSITFDLPRTDLAGLHLVALSDPRPTTGTGRSRD